MKERTINYGGEWGLATAIVLIALWLFCGVTAFASTSAPGNVTVKWNTLPIVKIVLTQNYANGFGQIPATIGTQPAPTHGPGATGIGAGSVDFGNLVAGKNYIYRYAAHVAVTSTDANGVNVYGEGAADFANSSDGSSYPIENAVFYLNSTSGSPADTNTGFSPSTPFLKTSGLVTGGGDSLSTPASISYTTYPGAISTSMSPGNANFYYDFQLKVPPAATQGSYYVWIVYTVVGR